VRHVACTAPRLVRARVAAQPRRRVAPRLRHGLRPRAGITPPAPPFARQVLPDGGATMIVRALAVLALLLACAALPAQASFHLFKIDQVYSNSDGEVQYVVLRESTGSNGESFWGGQMLTTRNAAGQTKTFTFPRDLPNTNTASRSVLVATPGFAALGLVAPDYIVPARFIPTAGGTLDYAS